jgi:Mor family transcriptional regulator
MSYLHAEKTLPPQLVKEIQKYVQGVQLYIPKEEYLGWGEKNGTKVKLKERNQRIRSLKKEGWSVDELADNFHLGLDSIRKICSTKDSIRFS